VAAVVERDRERAGARDALGGGAPRAALLTAAVQEHHRRAVLGTDRVSDELDAAVTAEGDWTDRMKHVSLRA
jgi:hypothetical protein